MTQSDIEKKIFIDHYQYYQETGLETIKQQAGQVEQVSSDYVGRVIYELLQNAFDKADKNILVKVHGSSLFIANDGVKFKYTADYNYKSGGTERGDFQSLCSISTSTKKAGSSIGNKGVGFKSAFSIAKDGYVNVYTQGQILTDETTIDQTISFRIYDVFKNSDNIPTEFDRNLQNILRKQIAKVQAEQKNRGVPGYYYPLHIEKESVFIEDLFEQGFVTIIEVPFSSILIIETLFQEINKVHFNFVSLKYQKEFEIRFECGNQTFTKTVVDQPKNQYYATLQNDDIRTLAIEAGISLENPKVAFSFRTDDEGYLYNYLPTAIKSPFPYVDFNADFHTTVDRKSINFDLKIGEYNKVLLRGCFELYLSVLKSYATSADRSQLKLHYITQKDYKFTDFNWNFLKVNNGLNSSHYIMDILGITGWEFQNTSILLGSIAKTYFEEERAATEYDSFYENVQLFIHGNATTSPQYNEPIRQFKSTLANILIAFAFPAISTQFR